MRKPTAQANRKLACADFSFPLLSHDHALDLISMLEFPGVDIGLFENRSHLWPSQQFKRPGSSARALSRKLEDRGLRASDVYLQLDPDCIPFAINHPNSARRKRARESFLSTLEYASVLGCPHVTTLPGVTFSGIEPAGESWRRSESELAWRVSIAKQHGITFAVEAHAGSLVSTPAKASRLAAGVPGLTLTVDYTHFVRAGIPDRAIEPLLAHASHLHIRGARKGRLQSSFKENTIDYARILHQLAAQKYLGYLGVEYVWTEWQNCNRCDNLSETILFRDYLRSCRAGARNTRTPSFLHAGIFPWNFEVPKF